MSEEEQSPEAMLADAASQIEGLAADLEVDEPVETVDPQDEVELEDTPTAEPDPEEQRARRQGWRPKEEFKGDPKDWKDFKEFNETGDKIATKLNHKIDELSQSNRQQQEMIRQLIKAQGAVAKQAREQAHAELERERDEAIRIGDVEGVKALDEKIASNKNKVSDLEVEPEQTPPPVDPAVEAFLENERSWFNQSNPDMVRYAIQMEQMERQLDPSADAASVMQRVKSAVVQRFGQRVPNAPKPRPQGKQLNHATVESGSVTVPQGGVRKFSELPPEARAIATQFEKQGIMSKKDYMKQYNEGLA